MFTMCALLQAYKLINRSRADELVYSVCSNK